jgi:hypothetical protein
MTSDRSPNLRVPPRRLRARSAAVALGTLTATGGAAHADRRETSFHAHVVGGALALGDHGHSGSGGWGGFALRASRATRNSFQYDTQLTLGYGTAAFDQGTFSLQGGTPVMAPYTLASQLARLDAGITFRLGVQWIPTVRIAVGAQATRRASPVVTYNGTEFDGDASGQPAQITANLVGAATVGLDYRWNRRLIVGAAAGASTSVPGVGDSWRSFDVTAHAAYYFYWR